MDARLFRLASGTVLLACTLVARSVCAQIPGRFEAHSPNFIVFAHSDHMARTVSNAAEKQRSELAKHWLGQELPAWSMRCPIYVTDGPRLGAGGETRFRLLSGQVGNWIMQIHGTPERILDSVLPHELTHTILATYFAPLNKHVPRWADEGACTTVEHASEKKKHNDHLVQYLRTGRGISFNRMFSLEDYPRDILPLYAQGHSVVQFLIDQGGPRKFVNFLEDGLRSEDWEGAVRRTYLYETLGNLKQEWNQWVADGRPEVANYSPLLRQVSLAQGRIPAQTIAATTPPAQIKVGNPAPLTHELASNSNAKLGNDSWYRRQLLRATSEPVHAPNALTPAPNVLPQESLEPVRIGEISSPVRNGNTEATRNTIDLPARDVHNRSRLQFDPSTADRPLNPSQNSPGIAPVMVPLATWSAAAGTPYAIWR